MAADNCEPVYVEVVPAVMLTEADKRRRLECLGAVFKTHRDNLHKYASAQWHVFLRRDEFVFGQVDLIIRSATVGASAVVLGGIGAVAIRPEFQRLGWGRTAMQRAVEFLREATDAEFGVLGCSVRLVRFYHNLGWRVVDNPVSYEQPFGGVHWPRTLMILPMGRRAWEAGILDIRGLPW